MSNARITFLGANEEVTGSCTLVEISDKKILIDAGAMQSNGGVAEFRKTFNFNSRELDGILKNVDIAVATHQHFDHIGLFGRIWKDYKNIKVVCTEPVAQLGSINLKDGAYILSKQCALYNKKDKLGSNFEPYYTETDVSDVEDMFHCYDYFDEIYVKDTDKEKITITLLPAGHIIGASSVLIKHKTAHFEKKILFTGDTSALSQRIPFTMAAKPIGDVDYIISESTYGDREHEKIDFKQELTKELRRVFDKDGVVLMPAFAIHKTTALLQLLYEVFEDNPDFDDVPVYIDSKMAIESHLKIKKSQKYWDEKWKNRVNFAGENIWNWKNLHYLNDFKETEALKPYGAKIVISASGMLSGGRVLVTLKNVIKRKSNTILFTGYAPEDTLARKLLDSYQLPVRDRQNTVTIEGTCCRFKAVIKHIPFSGHADMNELTEYIKTSNKDRLKQVFLHHGDKRASIKLKRNLIKHLSGVKVIVPKFEEKIKLY